MEQLHESCAANTQEQLREKLSTTKHPLVLGVGGGNDAVSTLILQQQLKQEFGFAPEKVSIMAVLPDCLDYHNAGQTSHPLVQEIRPQTQRSVQGKLLTQFPERVLSEHRETFGIDQVLGISMRDGSAGMAEALNHFVATHGHDLVLACDVGGDFIAVPENYHVLSPMMDGYMLVALREMQKKNPTPIVYGVFGLGTDGETPPHLLHSALTRLQDVYEGTFDPETIKDVARFHREYVEPIRYSRTADFTLREILGEEHPNPAEYRARFHTKRSQAEPAKVYYGPFMHAFDPRYFGKYYLFNDIQGVQNPYAIDCNNGLEWFIKIQDERLRINHELNGQAFLDLGTILKDEEYRGESLFFGTPSHKFSPEIQRCIVDDIVTSVRNGVFTHALLFASDVHRANAEGLSVQSVTPALALASKQESDVLEAVRTMYGTITDTDS